MVPFVGRIRKAWGGVSGLLFTRPQITNLIPFSKAMR